ncbi:MAG: amidase family protein, partial [Bacilli bacterium]
MIKRRFVIGSYSLFKENQDEVFLRAQKCRRVIVDAVNDILTSYDAIYLPASPTTAPLFDGRVSDKLSNEYLISDNHLALANFAGLPSIVIPLGFENNLPFGASIMCRKFEEVKMFSIAQALEELINLKNLVAQEDE